MTSVRESIQDAKEWIINVTSECTCKCSYCWTEHPNEHMSKETLNKIKNYIIKSMNEHLDWKYKVTLSGGEPCLYNTEDLISFIQDIKNTCLNKNIEYGIATNLVYKLNDKIIQLFQLVDYVAISYDYSDRLDTLAKKTLYFSNVRELAKYDNINVCFVVVLVKDIIEKLDPAVLFDLCLLFNSKSLTIERVHDIKDPNPKYQKALAKAKPTNKQVREYLFKLYLEYQKIRKLGIICEFFDCMEAAYNNQFYHIHSNGECTKHNITFWPNGDMTGCIFAPPRPYKNIITEKTVIPLQVLIDEEISHNDRESCMSCKYKSICNGGCPTMDNDETGCSTPYKIFEYLELTQ